MRYLFLLLFMMSSSLFAEEVLVKSTDPAYLSNFGTVEALGLDWYKVNTTTKSIHILKRNPSILHVQKNQIFKILNYVPQDLFGATAEDNPEIAEPTFKGTGADPKFADQWGMKDIGVETAWETSTGENMIVAVLDTGVDYNHEDLIDNMWRNTAEIPGNGIDDDGNGYIDDIVGWDFAAKDNKPYDLKVGILEMLTGGNPGHGTHCAGNVAARANNGKGIAGVAPNAKIMALRFITEKGQGTTADAILAIKYAVDNGAKILSNSWGGEGQDDDSEENVALKEVIQYAEDNGVLSIYAAGNGRQGKGYSNDSDSKPVYPASYPFKSIISVAAIDVENKLGAFSNFGEKTVDIAAPGVKVMSTVPGNKYQDTIINFIITATWDGTSMAAPHVAGAAALYWSANPEATYYEVKKALLHSAELVDGLKVKTGGKLNVKNLMNISDHLPDLDEEDNSDNEGGSNPFPFPFPTE